MFTATFVYLYVDLRKGGLGLLSWFKYIVGIQSYLWYMSALLILFLIFRLLSKYRIFRTLVPIVSIISFLAAGYLYLYLYSWSGQYLNFFNWQLFFLIGYILAEKDLLSKLVNLVNRVHFLFIALYAVSIFILFYFKIEVLYWKLIYIPYSVLFVLATVDIACIFNKSNLLSYIGKYSFTIYLIHMPFAGIISNIFGRFPTIWVLTLLRPAVVLACVLICIFVYDKITSHAGKLEKPLKMLIGLR